MPEFALKYANARGEVRQQVMEAGSEQELRDKLTQQGYLVYSIRRREGLAGLRGGKRAKKLDMEKFLIFNQQFNTDRKSVV